MRVSHSPTSQHVVFFHRESLHPLDEGGLASFLYFLHAALALQEQLNDGVCGVDLCQAILIINHEGLKLWCQRLRLCAT